MNAIERYRPISNTDVQNLFRRKRKLSLVTSDSVESPSLQQLSLHVVNKNFDSIPLDLIPPGIGRQVVETQLARGNISAKSLTLALDLKVTKLSFLNLTRKSLTDEEIQLLIALGQYVEEIRFKGMQDLDNDVLLVLFQNFVQLRRFQYSHSMSFNDDIAMMIINNNPALEHFDVGYTRVTNKTLFQLGKCDKLRAVDVSHNREITDDGLLTFCEGHSKHKIEDLRVDMCDIKEATIAHVMKICTGLRNISTDKPVHFILHRGVSRGPMHNVAYYVPWT